jgi:hypothetical protein
MFASAIDAETFGSGAGHAQDEGLFLCAFMAFHPKQVVSIGNSSSQRADAPAFAD